MSNPVIAALRGSLGNPVFGINNSAISTTRSLRFRTAGLASILFVAAFSTSTTTAAAMATTTVPARMQLSDLMKNSADWLSGASLIPIDFSPGIGDLVKEQNDATLLGPEAVSGNAGPEGSICFVVRRPGWVLCREHGQQLTELAASEPSIMSNFGMFGVVKETGVDDEGLRAFQKDHFAFPLYRDTNLDFYRAFGDKKITSNMSWSTLLNPFKLYGSVKVMGKRMKDKNIEGNLVGEGLKTGGIIVFGKDGEPKYAYPEITGEPLETDDILAALRDVAGASGNSEL